MKERPILFKAEMVKAILEGRKTQTRRIVPEKMLDKYYEYDEWCDAVMPTGEGHSREYEKQFFLDRFPLGEKGNQLWVRETHKTIKSRNSLLLPEPMYSDHKDYDIAVKELGWKVVPSIHMPRWASRIQLEITDVRVERLNDISEDDAKSEGSYLERCSCMPMANDKTPIEKLFSQTYCHIHGIEFKHLWKSINGKSSWDENPWVWIIEFKKIGNANL